MNAAACLKAPLAALLVQRAVALLGGLLTLLLLPLVLAPIEQGYYFTFAALLASQIAFDWGFSYVVLQQLGHQAAHWQRSDAMGCQARARVEALRKLLWRWSQFAALLFLMAMLMLSPLLDRPQAPEAWLAQWIGLAALSALAFQLNCRLVLHEGLGRLADVARLRTWQGLAGSLGLALALWAGVGLWAALVPPLVQALMSALWLGKQPQAVTGGGAMPAGLWRRELWPMQWRIALSWLAGYLAGFSLVPLLFHAQGAATAGRLGLSQAAFAAVSTLALAWPNAQNPRICLLLAQGRSAELRGLLRQILLGALGFSALALAALLTAWASLSRVWPQIAERLVDLPTAFWLTVSTWVGVAIAVLAVYLRAHREEPLLAPSLGSAGLTLLTAWMLAPRGAHAMLMAQALGQLFLILPWVLVIFWRYRPRSSVHEA